MLYLLTFVMSVAPSVTQQQLVSGERLGGGGLAWKITGILPARVGGTEGNRWTDGQIFVLVIAKVELRQGWEPNRK